MPRNGANPATRILAALQLDRGLWIWLLLIEMLLAILSALGDEVTMGLRYDRGAIAAGGWWRLLTAHAVHLDAHHLILNELGLVLMWSLFARDYCAVEWCVIVLAGALAISCGLWWLSPGVGWYVGASGVLHTIMAAGTVRHFALRAWDRWLLLACFGGKLAFEQLSRRAAPFIVIDAHLYGALAGFAVGAILCWRMAIIHHRDHA